MIEEIFAAGLAPFLSKIGWQGFAYGLLGLKTLRKVFDMVKGLVNEDVEDDTE